MPKITPMTRIKVTGKGRYRVGGRRYQTKEAAERARQRNSARAHKWLEENAPEVLDPTTKTKTIQQIMGLVSSGDFSQLKGLLATAIIKSTSNQKWESLSEEDIQRVIDNAKDWVPDSGQVIDGSSGAFMAVNDLQNFANLLGAHIQIEVENINFTYFPYITATTDNGTKKTWKNGRIF